MNKRPLQHTFRGKKYDIKFVKSRELQKGTVGSCESPDSKKRTLKVHWNLDPKTELEIILHEALHACFWDLDDDVVVNVSEDISKFLWKLGYRRMKDE